MTYNDNIILTFYIKHQTNSITLLGSVFKKSVAKKQKYIVLINLIDGKANPSRL